VSLVRPGPAGSCSTCRGWASERGADERDASHER
jgi:hypothetical protein